MESPFTDDEKRFILAELIKASKTDMQPLVDFVKANCPTYSWFSVQLPTGRTVKQCIHATQDLLGAQVPEQSYNYNPEPPAEPRPPAPSPPKHATEPPSAPSISALPPTPAPRATTSHVAIQPRPNGVARPPPTSPAEPRAKKPRGRPPRRQNLRCGSNPSPRPLQRLAPLPPVKPGPVLGPPPDKGAAGEPRGRKRGRESSDETDPSSSMKPCPADAVKEIKAEASGVTPPACSESDGTEEKQGEPARVSPNDGPRVSPL